jgi:hypothetical protein
MREGEALGEKRNVNVVVRLVLNREGGLQEGEAVDAHGASGGRFAEWEALTSVIRRMVAKGGHPRT